MSGPVANGSPARETLLRLGPAHELTLQREAMGN